MAHSNTREDIPRDYAVFTRAKDRGQKTFTLVEQDRSAPSTICWWILQNIETAPATMLHDALEEALVMREFSKRKNAD
jgi:hypothetical protein